MGTAIQFFLHKCAALLSELLLLGPPVAGVAASDLAVAGNSTPSVDTAAPRRPLRVVRVLDHGNPKGAAGRMVISGRMADVCAELDRLERLEACAL